MRDTLTPPVGGDTRLVVSEAGLGPREGDGDGGDQGAGDAVEKGTQYASEAPHWSTAWPANALPGATPSSRPVTVQVIASVRRCGGTHSSTQAVTAASVGAMVKPQKKRTMPRT